MQPSFQLWHELHFLSFIFKHVPEMSIIEKLLESYPWTTLELFLRHLTRCRLDNVVHDPLGMEKHSVFFKNLSQFNEILMTSLDELPSASVRKRVHRSLELTLRLMKTLSSPSGDEDPCLHWEIEAFLLENVIENETHVSESEQISKIFQRIQQHAKDEYDKEISPRLSSGKKPRMILDLQDFNPISKRMGKELTDWRNDLVIFLKEVERGTISELRPFIPDSTLVIISSHETYHITWETRMLEPPSIITAFTARKRTT